jgi:hypothetical protein
MGIDGYALSEYGSALARSLLMYAERNISFEKIFLLRMRQLGFPSGTEGLPHETIDTKTYDNLLTISDHTEALQRMEWLVARIRARELPDTLAAEHLLSSWIRKQTKEAPKAIVIGFIIGIIPPIGVGHIKRKHKMSLIVEHETAKNARLIAESAAKTSLGMLEKALTRAGGNAKKFEPEIADWFFGERAINFYTTSKQTLLTIQKELTELSVVHYALEQDERMIAIAISPVIKSLAQENHWDIKILE